MRKVLSVLLALCMLLALPSGTALAEEDGRSGDRNLEKLTKEEIVRLLEDNPATMPDGPFETEPEYTAPYAPGRLGREALRAALNRLNALRRIAGLPSVTLDDNWCGIAQYAAVLLSVSEQFGHYVPRPADMDESFYDIAAEGTSTSNISGGRTLTAAIDSFMDDSDVMNIDRLGHRRWQLDPYADKVGFGYAVHGYYRRYAAEKVFDETSGGGSCDFDFIAWPASGNFPSSLFGAGTAWSVTVDPNRYQKPALSAVSVTLTRQSDGKSWTFNEAQNSYALAFGSGPYFNVDTEGYGVSNCIIFRPDGVDAYEGLYSVSVTGLKTRSGAAAAISYQVDFFDPDARSGDPSSILPPSSDGVSVTVKGAAVTWTDAAPFIDANGRTMVPLRAAADAMGLDADWDAIAREAVFSDGRKAIRFPVDSSTARTSDGKTVSMDASAVIRNDRIYAPVRYLAEYFGYHVDWLSATRTVAIT